MFILLLTGQVLSYDDLYFEIHIKDLNLILDKKLTKTKLEPFCKVYLYKNQSKVEISSKNLKVEKILTKLCEEKMKIVFGPSLEDYLLNFEFNEKNNDYNVYLDKTGVSEINEIWVNEQSNKLSIIEKRSIGTTRVSYTYKNKLIEKVEVSSFEGAQSIESKHQVIYGGEKNSTLPKEITSEYIQKLSKRDIGKFKRDFNETVFFKNYKIDKNVALNHFSKN